MNKDYPIFVSLRIFALVLAQVFICSKLHFFGFVSPMIYVIFLYLYPTHRDRHLLLTAGFVTGLILDIFLDSLALHTICLTIMCYIRPRIMRFTFGLNFEQKTFRIHKTPAQQRFTFLYLSILIHHVIYFSLEALDPSMFVWILKKVLWTSVASFVLSVLVLALFSSKKS